MERRRFLHWSLWSKVSSLAGDGRQLLIKFLSRFERELETLRKELAESTARSSGSSTSLDMLSRATSQGDLPSMLTIPEPISTVGNGSSSESIPLEISESKKDSWPIWFIVDVFFTLIADLWGFWPTDIFFSYYVARVLSYSCTFYVPTFT